MTTEPKIGVFSWAELGFVERRRDERRQKDRRDAWREWLQGVAERAIKNGIDEDTFVRGFLLNKREAAREIYKQEAHYARMAGKQ